MSRDPEISAQYAQWSIIAAPVYSGSDRICVGRHLGHYEILGKLGDGGMGGRLLGT